MRRVGRIRLRVEMNGRIFFLVQICDLRFFVGDNLVFILIKNC
jgi:hypothetical protein